MKVNFKLVVGIIYLAIISIGIYFLFSAVDIQDLMSYEFIRLNKDIILKYKFVFFKSFYLIFFTVKSINVLQAYDGLKINL